MLQRVGPSRYRASKSETVTVVAVARNNNGVESASFRYGTDILATRDVQGHPGCDFVVDSGGKMFGTSVLFDTGTTTAQYDLFEEDDNGTLVDLRFAIEQPFGPIGQFQVDGIAMAGVAAAGPPRTGVRAKGLTRAAAPTPEAKPARKAKKKSTKKAVTEKAATKKAAKKKTAKKKTAPKRITARAATSAAQTRKATRTRPRSTSTRRRHR
jgi:hypothetical protein